MPAVSVPAARGTPRARQQGHGMRLAEPVMSELLRQVASGRYRPGALLPREADLATEFQVSRTVIREAVQMLQQRGVLRVQQGRGTDVRPHDHWQLLDPAVLGARLEFEPGSGVFDDLAVVRIALESTMAAAAADAIGTGALTELRALLELMAGELDEPEAFAEHDIAFHDLVITASGNTVGRAIMTTIAEPLRSSRRVTGRLPGANARAHRFHEDIYACLEARYPDGAAAAMRAHLTWNREHVPGRRTTH